MRAVWLAVCCAVLAAQPVSAESREARTYTETFDGEVPELMLNGTLRLGSSGAWATDLQNGDLVLVNAAAPDAVRYISVPWLIFDGRNTPERTDGANVTAVVTARGQGRAGAGIMAGPDQRTGDYLLFAVGENRLYTVLRKARRKVTVLATGTGDSIQPAEPNELRVTRMETGFAFHVNGSLIVEIPYEGLETAPVGIGALGIGRFGFQEIDIAIPATTANDKPAEPARPRP